MSKELAEKMDLNNSNTKAKKLLKEVRKEADTTMTHSELKKRIEKARDGEYIPKHVDSWDDLWKRIS